MFEYVTLTVDWDRLQDVLNARGADGWRVVHIEPCGYVPDTDDDGYRVVLERPKFKTGGVVPRPPVVIPPPFPGCTLI